MTRFYSYITFLLVLVCTSGSSQIITTVAGLLNPNPVQGTSIGINALNVAGDPDGNIYFPDSENGVVRKMNPLGITTVVAGNGTHGFSGDGGPAIAAQLQRPAGITRDLAGNLYVCDDGNFRIRKISPTGIISTIAGNGSSIFSGDNGRALDAGINPFAITCDGSGNLYVCDIVNNRIQKISSSGMITTVAGNGSGLSNSLTGPALSSAVSSPSGIAIDKSGNLYITQLGYAWVRKVGTDGIISTVAGTGIWGYGGDGGLATQATFGPLHGNVAVDDAGNIYIADESNGRIRKISAATGLVNTIAGTGQSGMGGDGGPAFMAQINGPYSVSLDFSGSLYISTNFNLRKITPSGIITTIAGNNTDAYSGDGGPALYAQFRYPSEAMVDAAGNLLIDDYGNDCIRKVDQQGVVTTIVGNIGGGFTGDGGPANAARLTNPASFITTPAGELYISDSYNNRIRKVDVNGIITTIAGTGTRGYSGDGGQALYATLDFPGVIRRDAAGNLYFVQSAQHCIRKISPDGIITTIAGTGIAGYSGDGGTATSAQLNSPAGIAIDAANNLYVTDAGNNRIRKISAGGTINTIAGNGISGFSGDGGDARAASFNGPGAVAIDPAGNLFVCDAGNNRVRKITPSGTISTVAGGGNSTAEGVLANEAGLFQPSSVTLDAAGNLYISDRSNHRVRKVSMSALPLRLLEFKAVSKWEDILCTWKTSNELNTVQFAVQRSTDGSNFTTVAVIAAHNSNESAPMYEYSNLQAARLPVQRLFYRLEISDKDGTTVFSPVAEVPLLHQTNSFRLIKTPASNNVQVTGNFIRQVAVADQSGKFIYKHDVSSAVTTVDLPRLGKGFYVIRVLFLDGSSQSQKCILQ